MGAMQNAYNILVGNHEEKRPLGRPRRRWEGNIRMNFREIGWKGVDWIHLAQDRDQWRILVNTIMNRWVPILNYPRDCYLLKKDLLHGVS